MRAMIIKWMSPYRCVALAAAVVSLSAVSAAPAAATPRLGIAMARANPYGQQGARDPYSNSGKTFVRESAGNSYTITVTNNGDAATTEPVELVDKLPDGLVLFAPITIGKPGVGFEEAMVEEGPEWTCTTGGVSEGIIGASEVKCTTSKALAPGASYTPITLNVFVRSNAGAACDRSRDSDQ